MKAIANRPPESFAAAFLNLQAAVRDLAMAIAKAARLDALLARIARALEG